MKLTKTIKIDTAENPQFLTISVDYDKNGDVELLSAELEQRGGRLNIAVVFDITHLIEQFRLEDMIFRDIIWSEIYADTLAEGGNNE
jgi:hypothetical protein